MYLNKYRPDVLVQVHDKINKNKVKRGNFMYLKRLKDLREDHDYGIIETNIQLKYFQMTKPIILIGFYYFSFK